MSIQPSDQQVPGPLLFSEQEIENIRKGGKVCMISLAAGNGHKETAKAVRELLKSTYPDLINEESFFDPNNSAANHPGVRMWNRWQKGENIDGLNWMVRLQTLVDRFHYPSVRIGLCRQMLDVGIAKVIDTQTNSTEAICEAVGDYNDIRENRMERLPLVVRFTHGLLNQDLSAFLALWKNPDDSWWQKLVFSSLYLFSYVCSVLIVSIHKIASFLQGLWTGEKKGQVKPAHVQGNIQTIKILTDCPIYDPEIQDFSTVNYFKSLSLLPESLASRSYLRILSPPTVKRGSSFAFFTNPWESKTELTDCVTYLGQKNMLVRPGFKLSSLELASRLKEVGHEPYKKEDGTLYISMMLGGNGGESLLNYVHTLVSQVKKWNEYYPGYESKQKFCITVFCGRSKTVLESLTGLGKFKSGEQSTLPSNVKINPLGFIQDECVIAAVIRQADIHITRPGGISMFELDVMGLEDTQVLFHSPLSETLKTPSVNGLLSWECSNALWYVARRFGIEEKEKAKEFLTNLLSKNFTQKEISDRLSIVNGPEVSHNKDESTDNRSTVSHDRDRSALESMLNCFLTSDNQLVKNAIFKDKVLPSQRVLIIDNLNYLLDRSRVNNRAPLDHLLPLVASGQSSKEVSSDVSLHTDKPMEMMDNRRPPILSPCS